MAIEQRAMLRAPSTQSEVKETKKYESDQKWEEERVKDE